MAKTKMAGKAIKLLDYLTKGLRKTDGSGAFDMGQVGMRVVPDALFGGLAAIQTPGDLGDKLIAGSTSALGGSLGGLSLGGLTPNPIGSLAWLSDRRSAHACQRQARRWQGSNTLRANGV
jgi:hypothetical protein